MTDVVTLLCTVRSCGEPLARDEKRLVCPRNHSFDVARSGYINLLQPHDRRSKTPGDTKEAAMARRRFVDRGFGAPILGRLTSIVSAAPAGPILDTGCGDGHHLGAFQRARGGAAHGLDISTPAIELAAKKHRSCLFVVANADRFLPYADGSFAVITSITARINPGEFGRVLRHDGIVVIAVAAADDLIELRQEILGEGKLVDRTPQVDGFTLVSRETVGVRERLDRSAISDVMTSSYRAMRTREKERLAAIDEMDVTLSRDLFVFRR